MATGSPTIINQGPQGFGANFAAGVGSGIQQLMQQQVQHMQERKSFNRKRSIAQAYGMQNPDAAALLDDDAFNKMLQQEQERPMREQLAKWAQSAYAPEQNFPEAPNNEYEQPIGNEQPNMLQQLAGQQPQQFGTGNIPSAAQQALQLGGGMPNEFNPQPMQQQAQQPQMQPRQPKQAPQQQRAPFPTQLTEKGFNMLRQMEDAKANRELRERIAQDKQRENREAVKAENQAKIEKSNARDLEPLKLFISSATERAALAKEALAIKERGGGPSGLYGSLPEGFHRAISSDAGELARINNEIANKTAINMRGPVGKAKLEAAGREKTNFGDTDEAQISFYKKQIEQGRIANAIQQAHDQILEANGGVEPHKFADKIKKLAESILAQAPEMPEGAINGDVFLDDESGKEWIVVNGRLVERK